MKQCVKCHTKKSLDEFGLNKSKKDGRQGYCKVCRSSYDQQRYTNNSGDIKNKLRISNRKYANRARQFIDDYKRLHFCRDCGNNDWRVLQFDHLYDKVFNIADAVANGYAIDKIKKEIEKCEIRCANCHMIKTFH